MTDGSRRRVSALAPLIAARLALAVAAIVALAVAPGCATVAPKSRLEPQERVAVEIRGETRIALGPAPPLDARELRSRLAAAVTTELAHRRSIAPTRDRADAILALRLYALEVQPHSGDRVSLRITAAARVETGGEDPGKPRAPWRATEHDTPPRPFRDWVESDGRALLEDLDAAIEEIADDVVRAALRPQEVGKARP